MAELSESAVVKWNRPSERDGSSIRPVRARASFVVRPDGEGGRPVPSPQGAELKHGPESSGTGLAFDGCVGSLAFGFCLGAAQQQELALRHDLHLQRWPSDSVE